MKRTTKLLLLVPFALASVGACAEDQPANERVQTSQSAVASVVTFDNPAPPGSPDTALGTFGGIAWGSGWFWSGPYGSNSTNHAYFSSDVTSRSFSFASGPRRLISVRVYALEPGTLTLTDNAGQTRSLVLGVGAPVTLATNWTQASSSVTVSFSAGWELGLDDIATEDGVPSDAGTGGSDGGGSGGSGGSGAGNDASAPDSGNDGGGTLSVATFDSPSPPGSADSLVGTFSGIDFGSQWRWSGPYGADPTNHVYFATDTGSRAFTFVGGARVLESVRAYVLTAGTLTLADSNGQTRSQALVPGALSTITTGWSQTSTTITVSFTGGWALGLDDIASRGAGVPTDAGTGGGSGGTTSGGSLRFVQNAANDHEYARHTAIPTGFGAAEFTLEVRLTLSNGPSGDCSGGAAQLTNWCTANNAPYSSPVWWYEGNFLLDGHNNANFANGTFSLQFYGGGRIRWLFGDGAVDQPGQVWSVPGTATSATSAPSLLDSAAHLVTLVRRFTGATGSTLELWIDGVLVASQLSPVRANMRQWWNSWPGFPGGQSGWFWGAEKQAAIGVLSQYEDFKGLLHEVRFWSVARSASAIAASPSTPVPAGAPGLVGRFDFDEGSGSQTCDSVSNACMTLHDTTASVWDP
jgi:hypothetical protein